MLERKLFYEIPGGMNNFHSAVLTSFSFNYHHFEFQVLRELRRKWISSVLVLTDQRMQDNILGIASANLKQLSQSYSVVGIASKGAFHPKISFFIGDEKLLVLFGSGNITPGGHGKNHELFTGFYVDKNDKRQLPLIVESWQYILSISKDIEGYFRNHISNVIPGTNKLLVAQLRRRHRYTKLDDAFEIALLYNEETNIFQQLVTLVPQNEITKISVFCPYYDEGGETLIKLQEHFQHSHIDVYLPKEFGLPPTGMAQNSSIKFYNWEETERGKKTISSADNYKRKLHSKIFHFQSEDFEYCLIGSANATIKAFGSLSVKSSNEEFCALYKTKEKGFLQLLGLYGPKKPISLRGYFRSRNVDAGEGIGTRKNIHITSVDLNGSKLKVYFKIVKAPISSSLSIYDGAGRRIYSELIDFTLQNPLSIILKNEIISKDPGYIVAEDSGGKAISNKQLINLIDKLINTDPSKGNRNVRQILSAIEGGKINEFEIIEYLNNLQNSKKSIRISAGFRQSDDNSETDDDSISAGDMTYEEAVMAASRSKDNEHMVKINSSTRLWESMAQLFREKQTSNDDELMDEEEEAEDVSVGRDRKPATTDEEPIHFKKANVFLAKISSANKMVENYLNGINKVIYSSNHEIDIIDLSQFLLVSHIFTILCNFTEFRIDTVKNTEDEYVEPIDWKSYLSENYNQLMMDILTSYLKLCQRFSPRTYPDNEFLDAKIQDYQQKAIYHFWVYLYLLQRNINDESIIEKIGLLGLNSLRFMGIPDLDFEVYLRNMSSSYNDLYFNPSGVVRLKESILAISDDLDFHNRYFLLDHSGVCKIVEVDSKDVVYKSLYGKVRVSVSKIAKTRKRLYFNR